MKKILALALALIMVLGLATTVSAVEKNDSITVTGTKVGETYNLYQLFDLKVNDEEAPTAYSYTINAAWKDFFTTGAGKDYITVNDAGYVTAVSDAAALAKAAAALDPKPAVVQSKVADAETVVFDGLANGYWLITSSLGTKAMIETTPDAADVTINEKNPEDTIKKQVKEDSTGEYGESNDAQVGDTVEFKSTVTLVPGTRNVKIHDTMDEGLTYNNDVKIYTDAEMTVELAAANYEVLATPDAGDTFTIKFADSYINALTSETTLYVKYSAVLNENAVKDNTLVEVKNSATITYGDKQSVESETTTTTHKFTVNKYADSVENLAGAVFSLKKAGKVVKLIKIDDTNYRVANGDEEGAVETFTTVASGDIVIWGVDADNDYTLEEITAPEGYNKLTAEVSVTVNADNSTKIDVKNNAGTELPSTGGMGTTLFYVIGGLLVAAAVVLLVTKKRMASAE